MKRPLFPLFLCVALLAAPGCMDRTQLVDQDNDTEIVAGLDYKDFETAAAETVNAILASRQVRNATAGNKTYVVAIGKVSDETPLAIDTDLVTARVGEALLTDDRFALSSVFADRESNRDATVQDARLVRGNDEFDQASVQKKGQLKAPDFSLTGKIIARDVKRDNGGHQYEYYFQLRMNDLATGTVLTMKETKVIKRTGDKRHTW